MAARAITIDPDVQGGTPCFTGTRVPAVSLFDHLALGITIDEFLTDFPSVKREQVLEVLDQMKQAIAQFADVAA